MMNTNSKSPNGIWKTWFSWVLTNSIGVVISFAFIYFPLGLIAAFSTYGFDPSLWLFIFIGALAGTILGSIQWLLLRSKIRLAGLWIVATALGWGLLLSLFFGLEPSYGDISTLTIFIIGGIGAIIGLCQWLVLRSQVKRAGLWILSTFSGYTILGICIMFIIFIFDNLGTVSPWILWIVLIAGVLMLGMVTGIGYVYLFYKSSQRLKNSAILATVSLSIILLVTMPKGFFNNWISSFRIDAAPKSSGTSPPNGCPYVSATPMTETITRPLLRIEAKSASVLTFSPNGELLASAGKEGGEVKVWDVDTGLEVNTLTTPYERIKWIAFSPDGNKLAIKSDPDNVVGLWDLENGQQVHSFQGSSNIIGFSPDGSSFYAYGGDLVLVYDVDSGQLVEEWNRNLGSPLPFDPLDYPLKFYLMTAGRDFFTVWNIETRSDQIFQGSDGGFPMDISPDGKLVASGAPSGEYPVRLWDVSSGKAKLCFGSQFEVGHGFFSPDGRLLAVGYIYQNIELYDVATGQLVRRIEGSRTILPIMTFSPDGNLIASSFGDGTISLWDIRDIP